MRTYRFTGGPFDQFTVQFPRPTVLDDTSITWVVIPHGSSIEAALAWSTIEVGRNTDMPMVYNARYAIYRNDGDGTWTHVGINLKPQTGRR